LSGNLEASNSWNPKGLSRPVMGLLFLYGRRGGIYSLHYEGGSVTQYMKHILMLKAAVYVEKSEHF
jgi:hypothetical protein